jgi:hypothetical protein
MVVAQELRFTGSLPVKTRFYRVFLIVGDDRTIAAMLELALARFKCLPLYWQN